MRRWILTTVLAVGAVGSVATVGKERKPITPAEAATCVAVTLALILFCVGP